MFITISKYSSGVARISQYEDFGGVLRAELQLLEVIGGLGAKH